MPTETAVGRIIQTRRQVMGLTMAGLSAQMGGQPGESFLSRVETGQSGLSPQVAVRLADALRLPRDVVLHAFGHATQDENAQAVARLRELAGEAAPIAMNIPVMDPVHPDAQLDGLPWRSRLVRRKGDFRLVDLDGKANSPFEGEVLFEVGREPADGLGVVALVDDVASAWTYHHIDKKIWIENGAGQRRSTGFTILGVIIRVATERNLLD